MVAKSTLAFTPVCVAAVLASVIAGLWGSGYAPEPLRLNTLGLAAAGGRPLSSTLPLWEFTDALKPDEVDALLARLPAEGAEG